MSSVGKELCGLLADRLIWWAWRLDPPRFIAEVYRCPECGLVDASMGKTAEIHCAGVSHFQHEPATMELVGPNDLLRAPEFR